MNPPQKAEAAFLKRITDAIAADVLSSYTSHTAGQAADGSESGRVIPCFVVNAKDMPEYPKFTGNVRGNIEVQVLTSADRDPEVENDDPVANHAQHVGLVGDALRPTDDESLESLLTAAGRVAVTDFTCLQVSYKGTTEMKIEGRNFETTHVFQCWMAPSNVS
jgi:hypothetical protein